MWKTLVRVWHMTCPMRPSTVLLKAADLLETPGTWTKGTFAKDRLGMVTSPAGADAVQWCAYGALIKIARENGYPFCPNIDEKYAPMDVILPALRAAGIKDITSWSDTRETVTPIVEAFREAARRVR